MATTKSHSPELTKLQYSQHKQRASESQADSQRLLSLLEIQKTSQILDLNSRVLNDDSAAMVAEFLSLNTDFTSIELKGSHLSSEGFSFICKALAHSRKIQAINAESNLIGINNSGFEALYELVRSSYSLISLDLQSNCIKSNSWPILASIIRDSRNLQSIDLRWNELDDESAKAILEVLEAQSRKTHVDLRGNNLSEDVLLAIQKFTVAKERNGPSPGIIKKPFSAKQKYSNLNSGNLSPKSVTFENILTSSHHDRYPQSSRPLYKPGSERKEAAHWNRKGRSFEKSDHYTHSRSFDITKENSPPTANTKESSGIHTLSTPESKRSFRNYTESEDYLEDRAKITLPTEFTFAKKQPLNHSHRLNIDPMLLRTSPSKDQMYYHHTEELQKMKAFYEKELEEVQMKYQVLLETHLQLAKSLQAAETNLKRENQRSNDLELKCQANTNALDAEKKFREESEQKCVELREGLRQKEVLCADLTLRCEVLAQEAHHLKNENQKLSHELRKNDEENRQKFKKSETQYMNQICELAAQLEGMRKEFERVSQSHTAELREVNREWEVKVEKIELQRKETDRTMKQQENQIKGLNNQIQEIHANHEEKIKQLERAFQSEKADEIDRVKSAAATEINRISEERDEANKKFEKFLLEVQEFEKKVNDGRAAWAAEETRLKNEIEELKKKGIQAHEDIQARDTAISSLRLENENLRKDLERTRDAQRQDHERFNKEFDDQKKRHAEFLHFSEERNQELEKLLRTAEEESSALRSEIERIKNVLQGNIGKIIAKSFSSKESTSNFKNI